jgi:hypothetical protein
LRWFGRQEKFFHFFRDFLFRFPYKLGMPIEMVCQGRPVTDEQLLWLRQWISEHPRWSRKRLSRELCQRWDWRNGRGQIKDFAARAFLEKLAVRGLLLLPALQMQRSHPRPKGDERIVMDWPTEPIGASLQQLEPLQWIVPSVGAPEAKRFDGYLRAYHYLGLRVVGQNIKYLVRDRQGRDLAGLLFGAAAWRTRVRDQFIGWDQAQRAASLHHLANNTRYLILPWVRVPGLASHLLSQAARRVSQDWQEKYGHPIYLLESFVQAERFRGTCYRAANWLCVGQTRGRGRQGPNPLVPTEPRKDVYLYPLTRHFRHYLREG